MDSVGVPNSSRQLVEEPEDKADGVQSRTVAPLGWAPSNGRRLRVALSLNFLVFVPLHTAYLYLVVKTT